MTTVDSGSGASGAVPDWSLLSEDLGDAPSVMDTILEWACRPGHWRRLPNVDIHGRNTEIRSFAHAGRILRRARRALANWPTPNSPSASISSESSSEYDSETETDTTGGLANGHAVAVANANANADPHTDTERTTIHYNVHDGGPAVHGAWASFDAADEIEQPAWFSRAPPGASPVFLVPTYSNVIITFGSGMSIGMHEDTDNRDKQSEHRVPVCTYVYVAVGEKFVVLVPPDTACDDLALLSRLWVGPAGLVPDAANPGDLTCSDNVDRSCNDDVDLARRRLREAGGYMFRLRAGQLLLLPKRWQHWLIAYPGESVTLSASRL